MVMSVLAFFNMVRMGSSYDSCFRLDLVDPLFEPCMEGYNIPIVDEVLDFFFFIQFHQSDFSKDKWCYQSVHFAISPYFFTLSSMIAN